MKIIDSNIIIYSIDPQYNYLRSLVHDLELQTRNIADFKNIPKLKLYNPIT